jgi:predicted enzyme related to lactoylglutathione lyase
MTNSVTLLLLIAAAFLSGFALKSVLATQTEKKESEKMKRVTGIGGVFFKSENPRKLKEWYKVHLGLNTDDYGTVFEWYQGADSTRKGFTQWSPFIETTKYFEPSQKDFMMNYRVHDLATLVELLKAEGVAILDTIETYDYGKFVHITDPEGNKIELWEPNDIEFEKLGKSIGAITTK